MATRRWQGGAPSVAQAQTYAFGGTWEVGDLIRVTIGAKSWDYAVTSTTITTFLPLFVTAFNALSANDYPEFAELTASSNSTTLTLTADTSGLPFTCTLTPLESNGGAADAQTIEGAGVATAGTTATACSSPHHWSIAANWREAAVPVTGDDVIIDEGPSILYGLDQSAVTLASLRITPNYPALSEIGLPNQTDMTNPSSGYPEYRDRRLKIGATVVDVETVSRRVRLDLDTDPTTVTVNATGQPQNTQEPPLDLLGVNASNELRVNRGNVWLAVEGGTVATFATVVVGFRDQVDGDSQVRLGRGLTLTTLRQTGGQVTLECAATTVTKTGGTLTRQGSGAITTFRNRVGRVYDGGTGTITALHNGDAYHFVGRAALTVTDATVYEGSKTNDANARVTWTNAPQFYECHPAGPPEDPGPSPAWFNFGFHKKITIADI